VGAGSQVVGLAVQSCGVVLCGCLVVGLRCSSDASLHCCH